MALGLFIDFMAHEVLALLMMPLVFLQENITRVHVTTLNKKNVVLSRMKLVSTLLLVYAKNQMNRPFPNYLRPLFQSES